MKQELCLSNCTEKSSKAAVEDGGERRVPRWRGGRVVVPGDGDDHDHDNDGGGRVVVPEHQHRSAGLAWVRQTTMDRATVVDEGGACRDADYPAMSLTIKYLQGRTLGERQKSPSAGQPNQRRGGIVGGVGWGRCRGSCPPGGQAP